MYSPTRITIDTGALQNNFKLLSSQVDDKCQTAAVVKANAYGLGIDIAVPALENAGAAFFYVATPDEALQLRRLTSKPIAMLSGFNQNIAPDLKQNRIVPVLNTEDDILSCPTDLPSIWHIDSGMNRLGLNVYEVQGVASRAPSLPILMMTHFASSDELESRFSTEQVQKFDSCIAGLPKPFQILPQSLCNSSAVFRNTDWHRAQTRPGYALYGGNPTPETINPMKAVVSLDACILQIRKARKGETVGYNQTSRLDHDTILATVGLGYADGFLRSGSNSTQLYWHGHPCPVRGRVSMDLVVVDIGQLPDTCPAPTQGDWMEIIGPHQSIDNLARQMGTIGYEILTSLSRRAARIVKNSPENMTKTG